MPQFEVAVPFLEKINAQWGDRSQGEKTAIAVAGSAVTLALGVLLYRRYVGVLLK